MSTSSLYLIVKQTVARYCSYQERNRREVENKIATFEGLSPAAMQQLVEELIEENFLDEQRYTAAFVHDKFYLNKWGKRKIYHSLLGTGIADKLIQDALSQIPLEDYKKTATTLAQKKKTSLGSSDAEAIILIVKEKAKFFGAPPT